MKPILINLGKVSLSCEETWENKSYDRITLVGSPDGNKTYISKKDVPKGISLENKEYWQLIATIDKGVTIVVDKELSPTSTNTVENRAIYEAIANLQRQINDIIAGGGGTDKIAEIINDTLYIYKDADIQNDTLNIKNNRFNIINNELNFK